MLFFTQGGHIGVRTTTLQTSKWYIESIYPSVPVKTQIHQKSSSIIELPKCRNKSNMSRAKNLALYRERVAKEKSDAEAKKKAYEAARQNNTGDEEIATANQSSVAQISQSEEVTPERDYFFKNGSSKTMLVKLGEKKIQVSMPKSETKLVVAPPNSFVLFR